MRGLIPGSCISPARVHKHSRSLFPSQNERGFLLSNVNSGLHNSAIFVPDECVAAWLHPPSTYTGLHSPTYTSHIPRTWTIHPLLHYTIYLPLLSTIVPPYIVHPPLYFATVHLPPSCGSTLLSPPVHHPFPWQSTLQPSPLVSRPRCTQSPGNEGSTLSILCFCFPFF